MRTQISDMIDGLRVARSEHYTATSTAFIVHSARVKLLEDIGLPRTPTVAVGCSTDSTDNSQL